LRAEREPALAPPDAAWCFLDDGWSDAPYPPPDLPANAEAVMLAP
jgi:hypothetical protein